MDLTMSQTAQQQKAVSGKRKGTRNDVDTFEIELLNLSIENYVSNQLNENGLEG